MINKNIDNKNGINDVNNEEKKENILKEIITSNEKEQDMKYIDDFKRKLKFLEDSEKEEIKEKRKKNKDLAEYQKLRQIWEETGVTKSFIKNFEKINNKINMDNSEDMKIIKEKCQISHLYQINI